MNQAKVLISAFLAAALLLPVSVGRARQASGDAKQQAPSAPAPNQQQTAPPPNQQPPSQSGQTFTVKVNLVDVLFTVLNRRNKLVPDLEQGDFKVFDEGKPQEIRYFRVSPATRELFAIKLWVRARAAARRSTTPSTKLARSS